MSIQLQQQMLVVLERLKNANDSITDLKERVETLERQVKEPREAKRGLFGGTLSLGKSNV